MQEVAHAMPARSHRLASCNLSRLTSDRSRRSFLVKAQQALLLLLLLASLRFCFAALAASAGSTGALFRLAARAAAWACCDLAEDVKEFDGTGALAGAIKDAAAAASFQLSLSSAFTASIAKV